MKVLKICLLLVLKACNVKPAYRKSWAGNLLMWSLVRFDLESCLQGQTRTAKVKRSYNLLIIDPRGLGCETSL